MNRVFAVALCVVHLLLFSPALRATEPDTAQDLVKRALQAELRGDSMGRIALLDQARRVDPNFAPARWHAGQVQVDNQWMTLKEAADHYQSDPLLSQYRSRRERTKETPADELALARWCDRNAMSNWGDTHYLRVLYSGTSSAKEREAAAKALDLTLHQGRPVREDALPELRKKERRDQAAVADWARRIAQLTRQLASRAEFKRDRAQSELRAISDVYAVPAIEAILSPSSDQASLLAVSILAAIPEHAATQSLVRHAVLSPWPSVARAAMQQLKTRPLHDYMPYLLGALETPIQFDTQVQIGANGQLTRDFVLFREGVRQDYAHRGQVVSSPTVIVRNSFVNNVRVSRTDDRSQARVDTSSSTAVVYDDREAALRRKLAEEQLQARQMQQRVANENLRIVQDNARVYQVLEFVTDLKLAQNPVDWWNWWRDHNDVYDPAYDDGKYTSVSTSRFEDTYLSTVGLQTTTSGEAVIGPTPILTYECFVEGTTVWSETGPKAIQDLRVGDRVLSQDVQTGELSFQGVLASSLRPPAAILRITLAGSSATIECTHGHPYWVNGVGWRMAKELQPGDLLHTTSGPVEVASVEPLADRQPAYNLLVAVNGNYFVGPLGVLVHDNTYRTPTLAITPGYSSKSDSGTNVSSSP